MTRAASRKRADVTQAISRVPARLGTGLAHLSIGWQGFSQVKNASVPSRPMFLIINNALGGIAGGVTNGRFCKPCRSITEGYAAFESLLALTSARRRS
jgi:hypothetical protein